LEFILITIFEQIELLAKLLDYFLRSNKSNINQQWALLGWTPLANSAKPNQVGGDHSDRALRNHRKNRIGGTY